MPEEEEGAALHPANARLISMENKMETTVMMQKQLEKNMENDMVMWRFASTQYNAVPYTEGSHYTIQVFVQIPHGGTVVKVNPKS